MTMFVVANLGDAVFSLPTGTVNTSQTITNGGVTFVDNTSAGPITLTVADNLGLVMIKDVVGNAGTYPITVAASAIDGGTSTKLSLPYSWVWLQWNSATGGYAVVG